MNAEFFAAIDLLEKTKGIPSDYMYEKIEAALQSAYKKDTGGQNVRVVIDPVKKEVRLLKQMTVVDTLEDEITEISLEEAKKINRRYDVGSIAEIEIKPKNFRRLSAQSGKQILIQAIREAEHSSQLREYESKSEEVINRRRHKTDEVGGAVMVDTGTSENVLLALNRYPAKTFTVGEPLKVFVTEVHRDEPKADGTVSRSRGPLVTLSRHASGSGQASVRDEIPEIAEGIVLVKAVAREAGSRTKIARLLARPRRRRRGRCIGNRGMRIGGIIDELRGEKIDVIEYSDQPEEFIASALAPADVVSVND